MKYDQSGPVTVNETKSFLVMVALVAVVGVGVGVAVWVNRPRPAVLPPVVAAETQAVKVASTAPAAGTAPAREGAGGGGGSGGFRRDGVRRTDTGVTYVRVAPALVTIQKRGDTAARVTMRDARITDEMLSFNNAAVRAVGDPTYASEQLGLTAEQLEKIKPLKLGYNGLAGEDVKTLRALFEKAEKARGAARDEVDAEILAMVKEMTSAERVEAFKVKIGQVMEVLSEDQEEAIRKLYNAQRVAAATRAASGPATGPASGPGSLPVSGPAK